MEIFKIAAKMFILNLHNQSAICCFGQQYSPQHHFCREYILVQEKQQKRHKTPETRQ